MNLQYKGRNSRGRVVWVDEDYHEENKMLSNFEMEEWQVPRYRGLVEKSEKCIGRKLTKAEAHTMCWLSSSEESTIAHITRLIKEAYDNGTNNTIKNSRDS